MAAPSRIPASAPKRKISDDHDQQPGNKRKSPLFNQPQKFYAPPTIASMTKDELSEWRKEQRRRRNRESAATSRNKTRAKIEELEGEVDKWKLMYHDMEVKTRCMERHIQFLTKLNGSRQGPGGGQQQRMVTSAPLQPPTVVSHPNSPPRSPPPNSVPAVPVLPNAVISFMPPSPAYSSHIVTHPFPALLSEPQDCASVVKREVAADADMFNEEESGKHLITIPRQA